MVLLPCAKCCGCATPGCCRRYDPYYGFYADDSYTSQASCEQCETQKNCIQNLYKDFESGDCPEGWEDNSWYCQRVVTVADCEECQSPEVPPSGYWGGSAYCDESSEVEVGGCGEWFPSCLGACCYPSTSSPPPPEGCRVTTECECQQAGGVWYRGQVCDQVPCPLDCYGTGTPSTCPQPEATAPGCNLAGPKCNPHPTLFSVTISGVTAGSTSAPLPPGGAQALADALNNTFFFPVQTLRIGYGTGCLVDNPSVVRVSINSNFMVAVRVDTGWLNGTTVPRPDNLMYVRVYAGVRYCKTPPGGYRSPLIPACADPFPVPYCGVDPQDEVFYTVSDGAVLVSDLPPGHQTPCECEPDTFLCASTASGSMTNYPPSTFNFVCQGNYVNFNTATVSYTIA